MNEEESIFLQSMIELVKYDYETKLKKEELLTILRSSEINFEKTGTFNPRGLSYQCFENVILRVPIPLLKRTKEYYNDIYYLVGEYYHSTEEYCLGEVQIKPKFININSKQAIEVEAYFDEIQETIIQGVKNARYTIWIAVAWFTDRTIYDELLLKKKDGLDIRVITSKEDSNKYLLSELQENFDTVLVNTWGNNDWNRIHDKFCIMDFEYVMHGSYNWSTNAQNNHETWATILDRDFVNQFADEFLAIYNQNK